MYNRQLSDWIGQYSAINLMENLMDDQSLIGNEKMVIEMISDQVPKLIKDQLDRPSNMHGKTGPYNTTKNTTNKTYKQTDSRQTDTDQPRQTNKSKQTHTQTQSVTKRQTDRQTDKQTERETNLRGCH